MKIPEKSEKFFRRFMLINYFLGLFYFAKLKNLQNDNFVCS